MKAIICLIAILAIASAKVAFKDVYAGFTDELDFTEKTHQEIRECATEVTTFAAKHMPHGSKTETLAKVAGFLFADDSTHRNVITKIMNHIHNDFPACGQALVSLHGIFTDGARSEVEQGIPHNRLVEFRITRHLDTFVSTLVAVSDEIKRGDGVAVGEDLAYLVEIATGLWHPPTIQDYIKEYKQPIEVQVMEPVSFIQKAINEAYKTMGSEVTVSEQRVKDLIEAAQGFVTLYIQSQANMRKATTFVERQVALLGAARDLVKAGTVTLENVQLILAPFVAEHPFPTSTRKALKTAVHNYYLHLPYIQEHVVDAAMGVRAHHPTQTGHAIGRVIQSIAGIWDQ